MNRFFNITLGLIFFTIVGSCNQENEDILEEEKHREEKVDDSEVTTIGNRIDSITVYQKRVLEKGDTIAYKELRMISEEMPINYFFFWCYTMANKYDYAPAYVDVFNTLLEANECDIETLDSLDKRTRKFALEYLSIGAKKGDVDAITLLEELNSKDKE